MLFYSIPLFSLFLLAWMVEITFSVGFTHCIIVKRREVYVCHLFRNYAPVLRLSWQCFSFFFGGGGPTVACHVGGERHTQAQHLG